MHSIVHVWYVLPRCAVFFCACHLRDSVCWKCPESYRVTVALQADGHEDAVRVLATSGDHVFSGSYDGSIGIW